MRRILVMVVVVAVLTGAGVAWAATAPTMARRLIGGGGGTTSAGAYTLHASLGQPITGQLSSGSRDLCAGFWCDLASYEIFLPLTLRQ
jgi:hypothetical protein